MPDILEVCPRGAWVTEEHAVQVLGFSTSKDLRDAFQSGSLPHVFVDHGKRHDNIPNPYNKHRFFFIQKEGTTCKGPSVGLAAWVEMCRSLENGGREDKRLHEYTSNTNGEDAYRSLKIARGIVMSSDLSESPSTEEDGGYRYGCNGGTMLAPSKASPSKNSENQMEGEVYTRADGKKVRRVRKSSSSMASSLTGAGSPTKTLSGFLTGGSDKVESKHAKWNGSQSVGGGEGEIYVRADGKKGKVCRRRAFPLEKVWSICILSTFFLCNPL
jgi:hypothetical protein